MSTERVPMLGARAGGDRDAERRGIGVNARRRDGGVDRRRRVLAVVLAILGAVLAAFVARDGREGERRAIASPSRGEIAGEGAGFGDEGARGGVGFGDAPDARSDGYDADEEYFGADERRSSEGIDLEALNSKLSGGVWDFNEARPRSDSKRKAEATRAAEPLPSLGQTKKKSSTSRGENQVAGVVAEGEDRSGRTGDSKSPVKKSSLIEELKSQPGLALSDDEIYDPAFVDDEYENGRRSGQELLKRFLNPPLLNSTWDTGRLRRLGRTLYLDGKPWLMRAVCYSPVPVGWDPDWFEPYGDFFTNDYAGIYERDLPLMAAAGVNTIRIYTLKFSKRHKQFFDLALAYNISIFVGYDFVDGTKSFFNTEETMVEMQEELRTLVRAAKHPAVVAWIVGNELNGPWNLFVCDKDLAENFGVSGCQFGASVEKLMKSVNLLCGVVREENVLCGTALANVNLPTEKQHLVGFQLWGALGWIKIADKFMDQIDFWGVNLYTRRYFSPMGIFHRFHLVSSRPFLITEYGVDAYSLHPQLEGWNGYDTMGTEDEVSQADWLSSMVEDIERHATTCKAGCGVRFTSGGAIMAWVDEYWKGKAVTPVPTSDERMPTIARVCPSLKEYLHSPCGYMSPTQPDLYVSEEWFGMMAVKQKCSINKVDLLRPRAAYYLLKLLWTKGGTCTVFYGQDDALVAYDTVDFPDCSKSMKSYHNRTMHLFMRAEAEAFHNVKIEPNEPTPVYAHFENFSAILNHPKGVVNPISTSVQSTFLTCHHMNQIHRRNPKLCPAAPDVFNDVQKFITDEMAQYVQPGDTSCPDRESVDALKLEVEFATVLKVLLFGYLTVAMMIKRREINRIARDAIISLYRSKMPIVRSFIKLDAAILEVQQRAQRVVNGTAGESRKLNSELSSEARDSGDVIEPSLTRLGPEPSGSSSIERELETWKTKLTPIAQDLGKIFGFQAATAELKSTRESSVDKCAALLWNTAQLPEAPKSGVEAWTIEYLHSKMFKSYKRYISHTGMNFAPRGVETLASAVSSDAKLCQLVLFELIYEESANLRYTPEFMLFAFHLMASAVSAKGTDCKAVPDAGLDFSPGDYVDSIVKPLHQFINLHVRSNAPLHLALGYDDINETFVDMSKIQRMLSMEPESGTSSYARFRQFMRFAGSAQDKDQSLSQVFKKTYREHLGWMTMYVNFHRQFTLLAVLFHLMVVHAFHGLKRPELFSTAAVTAAVIHMVIEFRVLVFDRKAIFHSRIESIARVLFALVILISALALVQGIIAGTVFAVVGTPYLMLIFLNIFGIELTNGDVFDGYFSKNVNDGVNSREKREYTLFWIATLAVKLVFDYVFMVNALVAPTRAILQIDLYCWNYNFAGEDCDAYDFNEFLPANILEFVRLSRRYGYKSLMLIERWMPNLILYFSNTFFFYITALGIVSSFQRYRKMGSFDSWSTSVLTMPETVDIFASKVSTVKISPEPAPDASTAMCAKSISDSWRAFSKAWNEIVRSLRTRDLLSNEELDLLLFRRLEGKTSESFFGSSYVVFPVMLSGPLFSGIGMLRNEKMRFEFSSAILAQSIDILAFVAVCILGIVDARNRVQFVELLKTLTELLALSFAEHSERAMNWLISIRTNIDGLAVALIEACEDGASLQHAVIKSQVHGIMSLIIDEIAQDRDDEDSLHKRTNELLIQTCEKLKQVMVLDRIETNSAKIISASASRDGSALLKQVHLMLSTSNPAAEPSITEAKDILRFFIGNMGDPKMPKAQSVRATPMMSTLTPVYAEEVRTSLDTLTQAIDGESVTGFRFMVSMAPNSWDNMVERTGVVLKDANYEHFLDRATLNKQTALSTFTPEEERLCQETITWASGQNQTLYRTVRGFASYADALRLLARIEGVPEDEIEPLVRLKYEHVVSAQVYGAPGYTMNADIEDLVAQFPHVKVNIMERPTEESPEFAIVKLERGADGKHKQTHRIRLPGNPIIGEGKPENQNMALTWCRGNYIQTIDMNQDAHLSEGIKVRNLLAIYNTYDNAIILGFPEQLISENQGSIASFAALSETVFGTLLQRFMSSPLCVRLHYGHPDIWEGSFIRTNGGVSKATKRLHLSEDVYGGMNVMQRGGKVVYVNFATVGKGREVSFDGNNQFNRKIATGNGMQLISRDFHRMAKYMDIWRGMSFFQSSAGIFYTEFMLFSSLGAFVVCKVMIAMLAVENYFKVGDAFDNVGFHQEVGIELLYPSQWFLQASLVMAWPGMLQGWLSGGLVTILKRLYHDLSSGSYIFNMFIAKARGAAVDRSIISGEALYRGTSRSMSMNASFVDLYTQYGVSHIIPAMNLAGLTILMTCLSSYSGLYVFVTTSFHIWIAAAFLMFSPWFFHPQTFKEGMPEINFTSWLFWLDAFKRGNRSRFHNDGTWWSWQSTRMQALRAMPRHLKFEYAVFRVLPIPSILLFSSMASLRVDDISTQPALRGVIIMTAGIAGFFLSVVYYFSAAPSFLWPERLVAVAERTRLVSTEIEKHVLVLIYNMAARVALVVFHHTLCCRLFADSVNIKDPVNKTIFITAAVFVIQIFTLLTALVGENTPRFIRPLAMSLRSFSDFMTRDVDVLIGIVLHVVLAIVSLAPISYLHAKLLFNRAYASVLGVEMRRRTLVATMNQTVSTNSIKSVLLSSRTFIRRVLGLQVAQARYARPAPSTIPGMPEDLTQPGVGKVSNVRAEEIRRRVEPIATHIASLYGFQTTAKDATFTETEIEVPSNLWNTIEAITYWLDSLISQKEDVTGYSVEHLDKHWRDVVNELHIHLFQNYNNWGKHTGMVDAVTLHARRMAMKREADGRGEHHSMLLAVYMANDDGLWGRTSREQTLAVTLNAQLHHLCLWFLIYHESANLRHMSELLCFVFHAALSAVTLEDTMPTDDNLILCKPVSDEVMPYAEKDFLTTIVTPLYLFLKREIADRADAPISQRVMYDDVNEFFWQHDRFVRLLPPEQQPPKPEGADDFIGVPEAMAALPREERMYEHLRSFLKHASSHPAGAGESLSKLFFKTHRETAGWLSMFVNFNSVILFHAVAFHASTAYVFSHGWNWAYISTATITHAILKFFAEIAVLRFRNLGQESFGDWMVTVTRACMFLSMPLFYFLEVTLRNDVENPNPYFEVLAAVYALANSGLMVTVSRQQPFVGAPAQMATPFRERIIYTTFWFVVLSTKLAFGHFLLITPLREAVSALQKGDLCWNKESDEYTSCINLEGDKLIEALKFKPKVTYFADVKSEEDYEEEQDDVIPVYDPIAERRRSLLSMRAGGGDFTGASWGARSQFHPDFDANESDFDPYSGHFRDLASLDSETGPMPKSPLETMVSQAVDATTNVVKSALGMKEQVRLPALGYIGEEIEGQLPSAYYDVHASQFLMYVLVIARMLPAVATYFCDTFLWYTCYASLFTIFLQWKGKVTHAQRWASFLRDFKSIPGLFCDKVLNRSWPKPVIISGASGTRDGSGGSGDSDSEDYLDDKVSIRKSAGKFGGVDEYLLDSVAVTMVDDDVLYESGVKTTSVDPADFLPEAMDIKWQHFGRGWNAIVQSLRDRDHISNKEAVDLKFVFLQGRDIEQIFDAPEYIILPPMLTSSVFSRASFNTGTMTEYPSFGTTLVQTKDLLCVILTEVLRVVSPGDLSLLMRVVSDLAAIEGEQMGRRRRDDVDGYIQLRDAIIKLLLTLNAMSSSTEATPIIEDDDGQDDDSESEDDDEEAKLLLLGDVAGAERARARKERRAKRRQLKALRDKQRDRQEKMVEAINLEMKFGCTGLIPKERRRKMKEKSGLMRGCFVVEENWDEMTAEQQALLENKGPSDTRKRWRRGRRKLIKWSSIQTDADIEAQSVTLAEALHDILLAVRSICSFAMEQDGKWSNLNNQRRYRVSQLYSQLLEMIRIDALRDNEHVRVVSASATLPNNRKIVESLLNSMNNSNPGGEPRNLEARRQLMFFTNSLSFAALKTPTPLENMRSWSAFTPYFAEEVSYVKEDLTAPLEDQKTLLSLIKATFPNDFENFKERIGALTLDDTQLIEQHWPELRVWTSDRTQSLSRCVRGICFYGTAIRLLARAEGYDDDAIETLVEQKFEYLVSCQVYGRMRESPEGSAFRQKARDIEELIRAHPELKVSYVQSPSERHDAFASCLIACDKETKDLSLACKIELPGNPIIGEGKPENQNHAVVFSRGAYLQTLDMNQDGYLGEALKMRNLLGVFHEDVVLVGFPETIFSETSGAVAQFAAISEFIFQTFQRFMTWPLMVRFHYGHPDLWDKAFTMTNGGISKASKMIHVAEDFFGGVNAIVRGGRVLFEEFIEVGKGRDMGFTSVNGFEQKISGSAGTISMSRDIYRLHRSMDFFRILSMYFSGPGFFISVMQTAWCVYLYILVHAGLAIADLEIYRVYRYFKMTETQTTLSLSKEEGGYYNSIYAIQLGLLTVLPLFLKMIMDRGFRDGFEYTISSLLRGSASFNVFSMTTKGYNYMVGLLFGQAQYIATERGYVTQNANMVVLYGLYAKSHLYFGMEVLLLLVLFHANTVLPKAVLYSWSVWLFGINIVAAPWWFSPQSTNSFWMQKSWNDWRKWLDGTFDKPNIANGSWAAWQTKMNQNYRNRIGVFSKAAVLFCSSFGRLMLVLVITGSLHGSALYTGVSQMDQFVVNVERISAACAAMGVIVMLYTATLRTSVFTREPWLKFPDKLWKISVYRGFVRLGLFLVWNGLYFFALHVETGTNSVFRTYFMTTLATICFTSVVVEGCALVGDKTIESFGEQWLPIVPAEGEPEPKSNRWRNAIRPLIFRSRRGFAYARVFGDFWYKEMDKVVGLLIFTMLFCLSLLPINQLQTMLIWNETFSDILDKKVAVQETVSEVLD